MSKKHWWQCYECLRAYTTDGEELNSCPYCAHDNNIIVDFGETEEVNVGDGFTLWQHYPCGTVFACEDHRPKCPKCGCPNDIYVIGKAKVSLVSDGNHFSTEGNCQRCDCNYCALKYDDKCPNKVDLASSPCDSCGGEAIRFDCRCRTYVWQV